jgi:hypothetical protein
MKQKSQKQEVAKVLILNPVPHLGCQDDYDDDSTVDVDEEDADKVDED